MSARATWSGMITFGMVSVPVKLITGTDELSVSFRQLDGSDPEHRRVKQLRWNEGLDREVAYADIVKGYEFAKGEHIVIPDSDIEGLPVPSKRTIEIRQFVQLDEISREHHQRAYYLLPDTGTAKRRVEGSERPYTLLLRALEAKGLVGVGKITMRSRERVCIVRPANGRLLLDTLWWPDEVRTTDLAPLRVVKGELADISDEERDLAVMLVERMARPFAADEYRDTYREALMALIQARLDGEAPAEAEAAAPAPMPDLMAALRQSIEAAGEAAVEDRVLVPA